MVEPNPPATDANALPEWSRADLGDRAWKAWAGRPSPGPEADDLAWHGLAAVLAGTASGAVSEAIRHRATATRAVHLAQRDVLEACRQALDGLPHLWLKGVAVGQYLYPDAAWRVGSDIDVLVPEPVHRIAWQRLVSAGLHPTLTAGGAQIVREQELVAHRAGFRVAVDLHWALSNHPALRERLTWAELHRCAIDLPIGPALHPAHALLHAVIHHYGHHAQEPPRLLSVLDIDLLWRGFDVEGRQRIAEVACELGIGCLLGAALDLAAHAFGTPRAGSEALAGSAARERSARFLRSPSPGHWFAWTSLPWRHRASYVAQLLFPPIDYMRRRYPASGLPVPLLYLQRLLHGLIKAWR